MWSKFAVLQEVMYVLFCPARGPRGSSLARISTTDACVLDAKVHVDASQRPQPRYDRCREGVFRRVQRFHLGHQLLMRALEGDTVVVEGAGSAATVAVASESCSAAGGLLIFGARLNRIDLLNKFGASELRDQVDLASTKLEH